MKRYARMLLLIAVAMAPLLSSCAKKEEAAPAVDAAAPATTEEAAPAPAAEAAPADAAAVVASSLPQACEDYLTRAKACFAKSSGNAASAAFQQGMDQTKAQWETIADKGVLDTMCKAANDQFAQTAAALKCE